MNIYSEAEGISVYFKIKTALRQAEEALRECEERLWAATKPREETNP